MVLDTDIDHELMLEGIARELVSKIQNLRKNAGFDVIDHINMILRCDDKVVQEAVKKHIDYVKGDTLSDNLMFADQEIEGKFWI